VLLAQLRGHYALDQRKPHDRNHHGYGDHQKAGHDIDHGEPLFLFTRAYRENRHHECES
jgi:hypothetical protein